MTKIIEVDANNLEYGLEIIQQISEYRPYSSISFPSSIEVITAIDEVRQLAEWGMGKNKHKMKQAVLEILESIAACSPGDPVNLNLTKYEHKSVKALSNLIKRSLEKRKDGVVLK
jgi:hypothetical protein